MAYQPQDDFGDEAEDYPRWDYVLGQEYGHPEFDQRDIDKSHEMTVPDPLSDVVDAAVNVARAYRSRSVSYIRDEIVNNVRDFMEGRQDTVQIAGIMKSESETINWLLRETKIYFEMELMRNDRDERSIPDFEARMNPVLEEYCKKVKSIVPGCLVAMLEMGTMENLIKLLNDIHKIIPNKVRQIVNMGKECDVHVLLKECLRVKNIDLQTSSKVLEIMVIVFHYVQIQVLIYRRDIHEVLKSSFDQPLKVTIHADIRNPDCPPSEKQKVMREEFVASFKDYPGVKDVLNGLLLASETAEYSSKDDDDLLTEKLGGMQLGASDEDKLMEKKLSLPSSDASSGPPMGPLSPPSGGGFKGPSSLLSDTSVEIRGPVASTVESLLQCCKGYGIISNIKSIKHRGKGFVLFDVPEDAEKAIKGLTKAGIDARQARVDHNPVEFSETTLCIFGLDGDANNQTLVSMCRDYGEINSVKVVSDRETNKCRGFGFVEYKDAEMAKRALKDLQSKGVMAFKAKIRT